MRVVVNTSPLIALNQIGRLELLRQLYGAIVRPQSVYDELRGGLDQHEYSDSILSADWIITEPDPEGMALRRELGAGETAAIILAHKTNADLLILDDLQARIVATGMGLRITGTLGVLLAAKRQNIISDLAKVIKDLQTAGFHISQALTDDFMNKGEKHN